MISADQKKENNGNSSGGWVSKHAPEILYPAINIKVFNKSENFSETIDDLLGRPIDGQKTHILTSLNRYERKKNIPLALKAFDDFLERVQK